MFICKFCNKTNNVDSINILIDQMNLILEMLKESLKTNFKNNADIYEKCLAIINLFKDVPCIYKQITEDLPLSKTKVVDKETQYCLEEDSFSINAEDIKTISGNFVNSSNFIYDERIGMYYDKSLSYYYDAEKSLYYDAYYGAYYFYDVEKNTYEYHSQIDSTKYATIYHIIYESNIQHENIKTKSNKKLLSKSNCVDNTNIVSSENSLSPENDDSNISNMEGIVHSMQNETCVDNNDKNKPVGLYSLQDIKIDNDKSAKKICKSSSTTDNQDADILLPLVKSMTNELLTTDCVLSSDVEEGEITDEEQEITVDSVPPELFNCVPCIRMIVKNSNHLKINSLYIITCTGATIGRETSLNHLILIPDSLVSKMHCSINYLYDLHKYTIQDHASQSGTYINGQRIGESKCMSDQFKLCHDDDLQIGSTILHLHIHPRNDTCPSCEPGNLVTKEPKQGL